jgi:hypothetical protein
MFKTQMCGLSVPCLLDSVTSTAEISPAAKHTDPTYICSASLLRVTCGVGFHPLWIPNLHLMGVIFLSLLPRFILAWMHNETLLHLYFFLEVPSGTSKSSIFILATCFIFR